MSASDDDSSSEEQLDLSSALGQLDTLQASIEKIEEQIAPLLQLPLQSVTSKLPSVQAAKLQAALAYASSALFFSQNKKQNKTHRTATSVYIALPVILIVSRFSSFFVFVLLLCVSLPSQFG